MSHNIWMNFGNYGHSAPAALYCSSICTTLPAEMFGESDFGL